MKIIRRTIPENISPLNNVPEFLSKIYLARGVTRSEELDHALQGLCSPKTLKGVDAAVQLLFEALQKQARILIVGDFDCDGATSTALSILALRKMGADNVDYIVPNRFEFGYGLSPQIVDYAYQEKNPDLIVTVDNGISSVEGVERAKSLGIKVLITDHHLPGDQEPAADAVVNPNQPGCGFESKNAAGVGVIFYVLSCLRTHLRQQNWFASKQIADLNMSQFLDLVALGTVADLVPLDRNNRTLVAQGIARIQSGKCRPGIRALMEVAGRSADKLKTSDLGFIVGPRLNAAGRLDDISIGIECLLADDVVRATELALRLDSLNSERKQIESEMKQDAEFQIAELLKKVDADSEALPWWGMSLYEEHWHQGVIGILASRVKEKFHRPVVAFAPESDDPDCEVLKGSARSIVGLHMRDALDLVAKRHPGLLPKFGGHAMAAGMSLQKSRFEEFQKAFDDVVRELLSSEDLEMSLETDGELSETDCSLMNISLLQSSGPWGQRFPEPTFDNVFQVMSSKVLKDKHLKLILSFNGGSEMFDAIQFNSEWVSKPLPRFVRVVYRPDINEFRGRRSVQFLLDYLEEA